MLRYAIIVGIVVSGASAQVIERVIPPDPRIRCDGDMLVRVDVRTARELQTALALSKDVWTCGGAGIGQFDIQVTPAQETALTRAGIKHSITVRDVQALVDAEWAHLHQGGPAAGWFDDFKDYDAIEAYLQQLVATYPDKAAYIVLGKTLEGNDIFGIKITGPGDPSKRQQILLEGTQHAREWISPMTCMYIADQILARYDSDPEVKKLVNTLEFIVVPVINGDGYKYSWTDSRHWRKNRRDIDNSKCFGVDTNRNWDYQFGGQGSSAEPCSETYRGESGFSEPETQVLRDFVVGNPRIRASIDYHSYGLKVMTPWGYTSELPPDALYFKVISAKMVAAIKSVHGVGYVFGPIYTTIYPAAGNQVDWAYGGAGVDAWTIELRGNDFVLPADQIIPTGEENFAGMLAMAAPYASGLSFKLPEGVPEVIPPQTPTPVKVKIVDPMGVYREGSGALHARVNGSPYEATPLSPVGDGIFVGTLPPVACASLVEFYFEASTTDGDKLSFPPFGEYPPLATRALEDAVAFEDQGEYYQAWTVGAPGDTATGGLWNRMDPEGTKAQPEDDHTPGLGAACWVTDGYKGINDVAGDVDGGVTSLTSPRFDGLSGNPNADPYISYWRWYSNNKGGAPDADSMPVQISNDDGKTWTVLESVSENTDTWVFKSFKIKSFVKPTSFMRIRFMARDMDLPSLVEAAVDDVRVTLIGCPPGCYADCDGSGSLDFDDFICFHTLFATNNPAADCDTDALFTINDFICFQTAFGVGCP